MTPPPPPPRRPGPRPPASAPRRPAPAPSRARPVRPAPRRAPEPMWFQQPTRPKRSRRKIRLGRLNNRLTTGFAAVCLLLTVIVGRLVQLQGLDHSNYADAASQQRLSTITLNALRGQIVDRDGTVLAYTTDAQDITVDPQQIDAGDRAADAAKLAPLVGKSVAVVEQVLAQSGQYAVLAEALPPLTANEIEAARPARHLHAGDDPARVPGNDDRCQRHRPGPLRRDGRRRHRGPVQQRARRDERQHDLHARRQRGDQSERRHPAHGRNQRRAP